MPSKLQSVKLFYRFAKPFSFPCDQLYPPVTTVSVDPVVILTHFDLLFECFELTDHIPLLILYARSR
jgi:hypothetical protein